MIHLTVGRTESAADQTFDLNTTRLSQYPHWLLAGQFTNLFHERTTNFTVVQFGVALFQLKHSFYELVTLFVVTTIEHLDLKIKGVH